MNSSEELYVQKIKLISAIKLNSSHFKYKFVLEWLLFENDYLEEGLWLFFWVTPCFLPFTATSSKDLLPNVYQIIAENEI